MPGPTASARTAFPAGLVAGPRAGLPERRPRRPPPTTPAGGWAQSQVVTYQVRGEPFDREVTSQLGLGLMAECGRPGEEAD